jgi:hypothetical protein
MRNECVEFLPTTRFRQKKRLSPKTRELLRREAGTWVEVPVELMPVIREVIAQYEARVKA